MTRTRCSRRPPRRASSGSWSRGGTWRRRPRRWSWPRRHAWARAAVGVHPHVASQRRRRRVGRSRRARVGCPRRGHRRDGARLRPRPSRRARSSWRTCDATWPSPSPRASPLILHCRSAKPAPRDAQDELIAELRRAGVGGEAWREAFGGRPPALLHSFSGPVDYAEAALELGLAVSFSGLVFRAGEEAVGRPSRASSPPTGSSSRPTRRTCRHRAPRDGATSRPGWPSPRVGSPSSEGRTPWPWATSWWPTTTGSSGGPIARADRIAT